MHCSVKYIFHNSFILQIADKTLLFDYPEPEFLSADAVRAAREGIRDTELYIFSSHSHGDHCSPAMVDLAHDARESYFIVAKDVAKAYPGLSEHGETLVALPGREAIIGRLTVAAFPSNDLGVAFLIKVDDKSLYFGGDLANWNWEDDDEDRRLEAFFHKELAKLRENSIDIAFSNADPRLSNWSGAYEVIEALQPKVFIPMHLFGKTELLEGFFTGLPSMTSMVWHYRHPGDIFELEL
ncbi:MAG TPA: MBL fold metallo-hydrolase [Bacillota bacterium]|nr:MBL fold metallo-hydrolase [Bacillota bacterium]